MLHYQSFVRKLSVFIFLLTIVLLNSCKTDPSTPPENQFLVEYTFVKELKKEDLVNAAASVLGASGGLDLTALLKSGAKAYRLTYKTKNTDGKEIIASGAVLIPTTTTPVSMISYQHGTITTDAAAPSHFGSTSESGTLGAVFAGLGYIIVMPDYIGYGASSQYDHPYEHRASLASSSLDMIRATREFTNGLKELHWNQNLYLTGYSEGGFATLSLQKKIEEEASKEFNLKASSCGAGAYNKTAFMGHLINQPTHGTTNYNRSYLWVLLCYNSIYGINKPATYFFKEPYAAQIANLKEAALVNVSFNLIINDSFKKDINEGKATDFIQAIADNDVYDWKPQTPTLLAHGDADELVFYFNTQTAYDAMLARGATKITLARLPGKNHSTAVPDFLQKTYLFFLQNQ